MRLEEEGGKKKPAKKRATTKKKVKYVNTWRHKDIQDNYGLSEWELPVAARDMYDSPTTLFELFITVEIVDQICKETNSYADQKRNHSFKLDP